MPRVETALVQGYLASVQDVFECLGWEPTEFTSGQNLTSVPEG